MIQLSFAPELLPCSRRIVQSWTPRVCLRRCCARYGIVRHRQTICAEARGRDAEFSVTGPPAPLGIDWEKWRTQGEVGQVPIMPFDADEIMLPGEEKVLHLYEARFLSLFEEVVKSYDSQFAHILISRRRKALAASGTLVRITEWTRLDVGVKVKVEGIGCLMVSSVDQHSLPFILGSVTHVDDADDLNTIQELLSMEKEFWSLAEQVASVSARLGISPVRSKAEIIPPTLMEEGLRSRELPKCSLTSIEQQSQVLLEDLRHAVERASWPCSRLASQTQSIANDDLIRSRLRAVSFVGFELFPSHPGHRQRALELRSTKERFITILDGCRARAKLLEAQLALRLAFPENGESNLRD